MPTTPYAWDADYDFKPIWRAKVANREAEIEAQMSTASHETEVTDPETGNPVVEIMWLVSKFDTKPMQTEFVCHGMAVPLDGNAKESIVVSHPGDPDVKLRTLGQHMIGYIRPVQAP